MPFAQGSDLTGLAQIAAATIVLILGGRLLTRGRAGPGIQFLAGWGALCLMLTLWGVATPLSLRIPALSFALVALLGGPLMPRRAEDLAAFGRMLVLAVPILVITATMQASQPDIFLNLLPNAAYLVDHATFPTAAGAPSYSYLPVAPYNTQFVPFLGSLIGGGVAANGLALFTVALHLAAGLILARVLAGAGRPGWALSALGLLLATLLNPGFVPRVSFAGYGEAPLSITLLAAGWLAVQAMGEMAEGKRWPPMLGILALVLTAMVNTKQQGIGLFLAAAIGAMLVAAADPRIGWRSALRGFGAAALPALLLYAVWRGYVLREFADGELKPLPFAQWQWANLPAIFGSMLKVVVEKPLFYACVLAAIGLLLRRLVRGDGGATTRVLGLVAAVFALYNGFLVLTYIGHFPGVMSLEAHSYFRYNTHLALLVLLGLVLAAREAALAWPGFTRWRLVAGGIAIVAMLAAPIGFAQRLRFDREPPQPLIWSLAQDLAPRLQPDDRLALLMPGDNTSTGTMLMDALRFTPPRRLGLDLREFTSGDPAEAEAAGYRLAFLSCTDGSTLGLPPHAAALLRLSEGGWQAVETWPYPPETGKRRWNQNLSGAPLCHG
ncbi:MAG: hypothetical protein WDN69_18095 [Aliidongia sp.]